MEVKWLYATVVVVRHHKFHHDCKARNRICYKCRSYGHYADYCVKPSKKEVQVNHMDKLTNKFQDDDRAYICNIIPFNEVEDIDFRKTCYFNNDHLELVDELNDDIDTYLMEAMCYQQEIVISEF
ncbi:hypothetical protein ACF0H5_008396 [Mactra antiquata]